MSFDRQIDWVCPHEVTEEALFVSSDRMTVRPLRPVAASSSVKLLMNNVIKVPSMGTHIPAKSQGTKKGPFSITPGLNDILSLQVDEGSVQTYTLPAISRMAADRIANLLNQQFTGIVFSVVNGRLGVATQDTGANKSLRFLPASTAATVFGFAVNRQFRGQMTYPGWTIVSDPTTLEDRPTRLIVFDEPLRSQTNFVEISYVTQVEECRRCGGTGYEHDWRYDTHGKVIPIRDESLLRQELLKDFYTIRGTNPFHQWYGTELLESIGKKLTAGGFVQNLVVSDIYQAFNRWQEVKRRQEDRVGQFVSDREFPYQLLGVNLEVSEDDPTVIFVSITVQNRSNEPIQLTRGLRMPEAFQAGTITQSLSGFTLSG